MMPYLARADSGSADVFIDKLSLPIASAFFFTTSLFCLVADAFDVLLCFEAFLFLFQPFETPILGRLKKFGGNGSLFPFKGCRGGLK